MDVRLVQLLDALNAADTSEHAWAALATYLGENGVDWLHYAYAPAFTDPPHQPLLQLTTLPEGWLKHYAERGFSRVNPALTYCRTHKVPALAGPVFIGGENPLHREFVADTQAHLGARTELVIPLRGRAESPFGGLSGLCRIGRAEALRWMAERGRTLTLAVAYADLRLVTLTRTERGAEVRLSPREREVLLWLAKGYRNDRIAERLGLSKPTVEFHLGNARRKMQAATREQAVARAVALGLLTP
jgi:DNA-binding CsgD family transcriptional regulator